MSIIESFSFIESFIESALLSRRAAMGRKQKAEMGGGQIGVVGIGVCPLLSRFIESGWEADRSPTCARAMRMPALNDFSQNRRTAYVDDRYPIHGGGTGFNIV
jgi:hypothetical protein